MNQITMINLNASRCGSVSKIREISRFIDAYGASIVCIQEINISSALKVFSDRFQVKINIECGVKDGVGIVTLVKLGLDIKDEIIGINGRIIGVWVGDMQIWNVYPKSGSGFKKERELFFREELSELFMQWKDQTKYIFELGDHNSTHRLQDSLYNGGQHLQSGLVHHLQIYGLSDDFLNVHGKETVMYSRVTEISKTRIDYIFSNSQSCIYFQYLSVNGLDHCASLARYEMTMERDNGFRVPKERYFSGWVMPNRLEKDEEFIDQANYIIKSIHGELVSENEAENQDMDPTFYWLKFKSAVVNLAKYRVRELDKYKKNKIKILQGFYSSLVRDIQNGIDCYDKLSEVKIEMNCVYKERSSEMIDRMRCVQIFDHNYDIHKVQNQKKYEGQSKVNEIDILGVRYSGTAAVVGAFQEQIGIELSAHKQTGLYELPTEEEEYFLSKLVKIKLSDDEVEKLTGPTESEEIEYILKHEVDLDSAPGEDGITYRFLKLFWQWKEFRELYLRFLNFTRENQTNGLIENFGIMTVKNKKSQSLDYNKKRKLQS